MNTLLLTVLALHGAGGDYAPTGPYSESCETCADAQGHGRGNRAGDCFFGPMPQSCYEPAYGCYASTRFMNRYPAFHGYYYRHAYNYRHYFDYPWHAALHEPTSHFSYNVPGAPAGETLSPPRPAPDMAAASVHSNVRAAALETPIGSPTPAKPVFAQPRMLRR
jgi:hypothetical protein